MYLVVCFIVVTFCYTSTISATVEVLRPRGVALSKKLFYNPDQDFRCIDGSNSIPFQFVNDDYCDCEDGSDEPGTPACSNALFHCINSGHISSDIPSSRVNDNICDCCDGSDEFNSTADCINICIELGRQAKEEQLKQRELFEQGFALWQQYSAQGKQLKENNKLQVENLKSVEVEEERIKVDKEAVKNNAEEKEKAALDVYKTAKDEQMKKHEEEEMLKDQEKEKKKAEEAFNELDINQDKVLTYQEIQEFQKFDSDKDGIVSEQEAKFFLHMKEFMLLEEFVSIGWMIMKPVFESDKEPITEPPLKEESEKETDEPDINEAETAEENDDEPEEESFESYDEDEALLNDDADKPPVFPPKEEVEESKPQEPVYDEETQQLVDAANEARRLHKEAVDKVEKTREEIRRLQADIEADFGKNEEFAVLKGQCFDFEDRYYTYRFCPFDKASQIDKSGGSDVSLGKWGSWIGPEENKYSKMKYENGQMCWNGPTRSVTVLLQCGLENKLLSSSEPNRCEYLFEFSTPSLCSLQLNMPNMHQHEEL
ncbi:glucosidase 2 subunit beta [Parasteatoda tepidariorum]|uniref:glucosidase 2 subunit beta n=1 Tax=Parasteatoda tepidariorum TaxID=114398 RepID=UPI001C7227A3|nr:glucosidase 2 subunit beta [Parasteatoda tepidariorum]